MRKLPDEVIYLRSYNDKKQDSNLGHSHCRAHAFNYYYRVIFFFLNMYVATNFPFAKKILVSALEVDLSSVIH